MRGNIQANGEKDSFVLRLAAITPRKDMLVVLALHLLLFGSRFISLLAVGIIMTPHSSTA